MTTPLIRDWVKLQASAFAPFITLDAPLGRGGQGYRRRSELTPLASTFREPRIAFMARSLATLQAFLPPPTEKRRNSFSLLDPGLFCTEPVSKIKWNLGALSSVCNLDCEFCYRYGSPINGPNTVMVSLGRALLSTEEAAARLELIKNNHGLFSASADLGEDFVNPHLLDIYRQIRKHSPREMIDTTTHGGFLTEPVIAALSELKPIDLSISLNSADPDIRRRLMNDKTPEVAIAALPLMARYGIWYSVSIVAWPTVPLSDLQHTVLYADANKARLIRIQLPGISRFHPSRLSYNRSEVWDRVIGLLQELRTQIATPIYWQPYLYGSDPLLPEITGSIQGSPAAVAGVRPGDVVAEINGCPVGSREAAREQLRAAGRSGQPVNLLLERNGDSMMCLINPLASLTTYPYLGAGYDFHDQSLGIFINQGLHLPSVIDVVLSAKSSNKKRVLVISSQLMANAVRKVLAGVSAKLPQPPLIDVIVPEARFFGGDIILGDLLVFDDIHQAITLHEAASGKYDEIVVPATMVESGTDLTGQRFDSFNEALGHRCRLATHPRILD